MPRVVVYVDGKRRDDVRSVEFAARGIADEYPHHITETTEGEADD